MNKTTKFFSLLLLLGVTFFVGTFVGNKQDKNLKDYEFYKEANAFKYDYIKHQDSLVILQKALINNLANEIWNDSPSNNGGDIASFDGEESPALLMYVSLSDLIHEQEYYIESLVATEL